MTKEPIKPQQMEMFGFSEKPNEELLKGDSAPIPDTIQPPDLEFIPGPMPSFMVDENGEIIQRYLHVFLKSNTQDHSSIIRKIDIEPEILTNGNFTILYEGSRSNCSLFSNYYKSKQKK